MTEEERKALLYERALIQIRLLVMSKLPLDVLPQSILGILETAGITAKMFHAYMDYERKGRAS